MAIRGSRRHRNRIHFRRHADLDASLTVHLENAVRFAPIAESALDTFVSPLLSALV
jgi:hypothetical protein